MTPRLTEALLLLLQAAQEAYDVGMCPDDIVEAIVDECQLTGSIACEHRGERS